MKRNDKNRKAVKRSMRVRKKIHGTKEVPRLSVFRSNQSFYAQIIDDDNGRTILGLSLLHVAKKDPTTKTVRAKELGIMMGKKAVEKKIRRVVFDRGAHKYHGVVKEFAQGAQEGGLRF